MACSFAVLIDKAENCGFAIYLFTLRYYLLLYKNRLFDLLKSE